MFLSGCAAGRVDAPPTPMAEYPYASVVQERAAQECHATARKASVPESVVSENEASMGAMHGIVGVAMLRMMNKEKYYAKLRDECMVARGYRIVHGIWE
jgi:hypothetical protein